MENETLGALIRESAIRFPRRTAIVFAGRKISYRRLDELSDYIALRLVDLGVGRGDHVAILLDNSPEFVVAYFGILKSGATVIPLNYMFTAEEARFILEDSDACCLITSRGFLSFAESLKSMIPALRHVLVCGTASSGDPDFASPSSEGRRTLRDLPIGPDQPAAILYTSGTTGRPKGAVLSHANLISNAYDCATAFRIRPKDTFLCFLPLFHAFCATVCMILPLSVGAKIVIVKSVKPVRRILRSIIMERVTIFIGIPSVYAILNDVRGAMRFFLRPWLRPLLRMLIPVRVCVSGAASLPVETWRQFQEKFCLPLLEGYGLTEASPVVSLNPLERPKPGSIGVPLSSRIRMGIVNEKGDFLGPEETGELLVKGPNVMQCYFKQEEATRQAVRDGWLYTGDMAKYDREGYFFIVGRKKEMINVRGLNVYPVEIENALLKQPKIAEAAVVGVSDIHKGEVPKAFIVLKDGQKMDGHDVVEYLRGHLAPYKIPKFIEFRDSLPKSSTGKILKRLLTNETAKTD